MFGRPKLDIIDLKRYLIDNLREFDYNIHDETDKWFTVDILLGARTITVKVVVYKEKKAIVDIDDSHFLLRIPKAELKNIDDYKKFVLQFIQKIK